MDAYNGEQEEGTFSSSKDADLSNRLKDIPQDRLVKEIIALWDEVNNLEFELIKNKNNDIPKKYSTEKDRSIIADYEEKIRVADIKIARLEKQLHNEKIRRESLDLDVEKIKKLELENTNLLKNEEELMILIMDMERHIEKLVESIKEK
mgnify:CR=1 FL=1|tara:strand:+ start:2744 stop:3190 length:447 start_codon:yes stop_codon:yes gene_type:complete